MTASSGVWRGRSPALDGVRAVAVAAVLAFHGGFGWASGGMLGVDVFFALSGFLITSLLVAEVEDTGSVRLGGFWARRARRLLPALFLLLLGVALYARYVSGGDGLGVIRSDGLATLLYGANWHQIVAGQGYFVRTGAPSPLLHTWSLAIEEQFYLVWPLVVLAVARGVRSAPGRSARRVLGVVAGAGALLSALLMAALYQAGVSTDRLYYGTDTRAQAIMVGAFLALAGPPVARRLRQRPGLWRLLPLAAAAAAGFLLWAFASLSGTEPTLYRGGFLAVSVASAVLIGAVVARPTGSPAWVLARRPMVGLGRISYGVYLYHWPVFLWLNDQRTGLHGVALFAVRCLVTLVVAIASFVLVEEPIRRRRFLTGLRSLAAVPVAAACTVAALLLTTVPSAAGSVASVRHNRAYAVSVVRGQQAISPARSFLRRHPVRYMVFGDSVALTLAVPLQRQQTRWGVHLDLAPTVDLGCDLDPYLLTDTAGNLVEAPKGCADWRQQWPALVRRYDPDVSVVLFGRWELSGHRYDGRWVKVGDPLWDRHLIGELDQVVRIITAHGAHVLLLTFPYINPTEVQPGGTSITVNPVARVNALNRDLRAVARRNPRTVSLLDLNRILDPRGHYTSTVDGVVVRWADREHISAAGAAFLQPILLPRVVELGLAHDRDRTRAGPAPGR